mgnify:CR=1 FL=1
MAGQYPNSGALFVNDYKEKDTHPDYKGKMEITIDGKDYEFKMAGWKKTAKSSGKTFISMQFEQPEDDIILTPPQPPKAIKLTGEFADDVSDDDLPF